MTKYSFDFKLSVVKYYGDGIRSYAEVADHFVIDAATVRKWVGLHAAHGATGLSKKFSRYSAAFKLSVLHRMWADGLSHRQAAAVFNIRNASSLTDWEKRYESGGLAALAPRRRGRAKVPISRKLPRLDAPLNDKEKSRDDLLAELEYLRMENAYLKKLGALTQEQAPIKRKPSRR